jgi:hypothetical protein
MANTTVSIRERIKDPEGRWRWSHNLRPPDDKLKPSEGDRKGKFYLVWTEGKKCEQKKKEDPPRASRLSKKPKNHPQQYGRCCRDGGSASCVSGQFLKGNAFGAPQLRWIRFPLLFLSLVTAPKVALSGPPII